MIWDAIVAIWTSINWDAAIAICTGILALFTAVMAWFTRRAIVESHAQYEKTRAQSEQHHQDGFRPVLMMLPDGGVESHARSNVVYIDPNPRSGGTHRCTFSGVVSNVGTGPALNVRLHFRAMGKSGYGFTRELAPIKAGGNISDNSQFQFLIRPHAGFNATDIATAVGTGWELVLEYEDVFGNHFHTIHPKNPQLPWTECGKGPAPT